MLGRNHHAERKSFRQRKVASRSRYPLAKLNGQYRMHALLAHAYHLAQHGLHILLLPLWRPPLATLGVAALGRVCGLTRTRRGAIATAGLAILAGWLLVAPGWTAWPLPPVARLPGLALILLAGTWTAAGRTASVRLVQPIMAALAAWWLRGAPAGVTAILACLPVFLGLAAALPLARRLARSDDGRGSAAAALVLAGGAMLAGAAIHWARAALVPAVAALVLLGVTGASAALSGMIVLVAAATLVASDRGRVLPVDIACLAPLLVWPLASGMRGQRKPVLP